MTASNDRLNKNLWFAYFSLLMTWAVVSYNEIAKYFIEGTLFARLLDGRPYINDTVHWYNAALLARRSLAGGLDIYDPTVQDQSVRSITAPIAPEGLLYLQYPPQFFPLMLPFSVLPISIAYLVWCTITLVLICITLWFLVKNTLSAGFPRWLAFAATLSCFPAWLSFETAQTSLFQFSATVGFWLLLRSKKFFWAGVLTAILSVKIQYLPALGLVGLILGRGKYLGGVMLSCSLLAVATFATVGWSNIANWPRALKFGETSSKVIGVDSQMMQNIRGQLVVLFGVDNSAVHAVTLLCFAIGVVAIALMWWKLYPRLEKTFGETAFGLCAGVSILVSLIASPHTHIQEYMTAAAAILFLYPFLKQQTETGLSKALSVLLIGYPVLSWLFFLLMSVFHMILIQPFFLWNIVVLGLVFLLVAKPQTKPTLI